MKKKSLGLTIAVISCLLLFTAAVLYAGAEVQDVIKMQNKAYSEHTKGIVEFTHDKHQGEYAKKHPDLYENGCGECHHDKDGKPLTELKEGDAVQNCIECHKKPGELPTAEKKKMREEKVSRAEKKAKELEYHAEALHDNCRGCHKKYNRKIRKLDPKPPKAPTTCNKCHPKS